MAGAWQSARLIYRALDKDEDESLIINLASDPEALMNVSPSLLTPQGKKDAAWLIEFLDKRILNCVVCLPAPVSATTTSKDDASTKPIPIGIVNMAPVEARQFQHRHSELGIHILTAYQGQGYGTEAINWALNWGFNWANLHRIEVNAFGSNEGAIKLYERIGLVLEGRKRDALFINGKFCDMVIFSILEDEWRARKEKLRKSDGTS